MHGKNRSAQLWPMSCSAWAGLQVVVAEGLSRVPVDAGHAGLHDVLADHSLGNLERAAGLAVAQFGLQVQAQYLSDSSHRDSVRWHSADRKKR